MIRKTKNMVCCKIYINAEKSSLVPVPVPIRHVISHAAPLRLGRQNLHARRRDYHCVFKLRRPRPVPRDCGPIVRPRLVLPVLRPVDHRLDRKGVPWLHRVFGAVFAVMRHVGRRVKQLADAVPTIGADDGEVCAGHALVYFDP